MREVMAAAEVGDDVFGEDPTVNELQQRVAAMLEKEAALFVPSGTMANLLAILAQTKPADTIILHEDAHPFRYESGGLGMVAGLMTRLLPGARGVLDPQRVTDAVVRNPDHHFSPTSLVTIEHTTNRGGGACYPLQTIAAISAVCHEYGMKLHCDGARLFNAVVATGITAAEYAKPCDTVSVCFSKGLGCPVGSILAGSAETIDRAHRYRKMLGGGMRQAGILAEAANYALDHHIERLKEDHRRTAFLRDELLDLPNVSFPLPSPTNILFIDVPDTAAFLAHCASRNVYMLPQSATRLRAVLHLDINDEALDHAIDTIRTAALQTAGV